MLAHTQESEIFTLNSFWEKGTSFWSQTLNSTEGVPIHRCDLLILARSPCRWNAICRSQIFYYFQGRKWTDGRTQFDFLGGAGGYWTHAFPYTGFDRLIFQDFKRSKKDRFFRFYQDSNPCKKMQWIFLIFLVRIFKSQLDEISSFSIFMKITKLEIIRSLIQFLYGLSVKVLPLY